MAIENSVSNDFYLCSSIVLTFSIAAYPVCNTSVHSVNSLYDRIVPVLSAEINELILKLFKRKT